MKIVRMLHPFCIPVFGYIAGGEEIGMPDNIADAMVAAGYAEWSDLHGFLVETVVTSGGVPPIVSSGIPPTVSGGVPIYAAPAVAIEPPTELPTESHKRRKGLSPVAEDAPAEEN